MSFLSFELYFEMLALLVLCFISKQKIKSDFFFCYFHIFSSALTLMDFFSFILVYKAFNLPRFL